MAFLQQMQRNGSEKLGSDRLRAQYAEAQLNNGTAKLLVEYVLDMIVGRYLNQTDEGWLPTYGNIIKHSTNLDKFYDLFLQLNDKVSHFLRSTNSTELSGAKSIKFQLVQDAAPFLRDIAAPRLAGMQARAKRGAQLLKETQKRQAELQNEIARTVRNGWVAPGAKWLSHRVIYYYLPDLKSMALQWSYARQWLTVELEEIFEVCQGREAEFKSHDKEPPRIKYMSGGGGRVS
ncbi:hypothetical protein N0V84_000924 [Fusarium piperis]|uniref:Uncharacterized protein n=1 Tax=Fusarium piperis TaxID=1435070 RepID=A0A9W9BTR8_9HYPO|nr:hypothetical protein N0V84_000924 [Fusarium piperis]